MGFSLLLGGVGATTAMVNCQAFPAGQPPSTTARAAELEAVPAKDAAGHVTEVAGTADCERDGAAARGSNGEEPEAGGRAEAQTSAAGASECEQDHTSKGSGDDVATDQGTCEEGHDHEPEDEGPSHVLATSADPQNKGCRNAK